MLTSTLQPGAVVFQSPFVTRMLKEPNVVLSASKLVEEFENLLQLAFKKENVRIEDRADCEPLVNKKNTLDSIQVGTDVFDEFVADVLVYVDCERYVHNLVYEVCRTFETRNYRSSVPYDIKNCRADLYRLEKLVVAPVSSDALGLHR